MVQNNTDDRIEYDTFKKVIANQCLMHDIENNFPEHCKPKGEPTKIEHEIDDRYYEHDCS